MKAHGLRPRRPIAATSSHAPAEHFLTRSTVRRPYDAADILNGLAMRTQITLLREQLARQLADRGADDPQVAHLRWQIASLERQARRIEDSAGMLGARLQQQSPDGGYGLPR
jgi:hypothetical protein